MSDTPIYDHLVAELHPEPELSLDENNSGDLVQALTDELVVGDA